jgi:hypothetical protein
VEAGLSVEVLPVHQRRTLLLKKKERNEY